MHCQSYLYGINVSSFFIKLEYFFFNLLLIRKESIITVEFNSRFIHPAEALLMLISKTEPVVGGITLTFGLRGELLKFKKIVSKYYLFVISLLLLSGKQGISYMWLFFLFLSLCSSFFFSQITSTSIYTIVAFCFSDISSLPLSL